MTPDERKLLTDLASKIAQTPPPQQDAEAAEFIRTQIGRRPDALYLMTQTVLVQNMALEHAKQEIEQLKQQQQQRPAASVGGAGFLAGQQQPPAYAPQAPVGAPAAGAPSQMGSFLRSAATTAAGVAAGALAFEGIRSLFGGGGLGHLGGFGETHAASSFLGGPPETIINNYYETEPVSEDAVDEDEPVSDDDDEDVAEEDSVDDVDYDDGGGASSDDDFV